MGYFGQMILHHQVHEAEVKDYSKMIVSIGRNSRIIQIVIVRKEKQRLKGITISHHTATSIQLDAVHLKYLANEVCG